MVHNLHKLEMIRTTVDERRINLKYMIAGINRCQTVMLLGKMGKWCNRACNKCGKQGHTFKCCPEAGKFPINFILSSYAFSESIDGLDISDDILLLDTGATNTNKNRVTACIDGSICKCIDEGCILSCRGMDYGWIYGC